MLSLPVEKIWGAGERTQARFGELGFTCIAQLRSLGESQLESLFGHAGGAFLYGAVRGRDVGGFGAADAGSRSMSAETTFERDCSEREQVEDVLLALAEELAYRLWAEGYSSRTLALKLRFHDFSTISRRVTRSSRYRSSGEVFRDSIDLLDKAWDGRSALRLLGLGFSGLEKEGGGDQGELFSELSERACRAESAVFEIEKKGLGAITRARLVGRENRGRPRESPRDDPDAGSRT
jgi:DNA polymerase-4